MFAYIMYAWIEKAWANYVPRSVCGEIVLKMYELGEGSKKLEIHFFWDFKHLLECCDFHFACT